MTLTVTTLRPNSTSQIGSGGGTSAVGGTASAVLSDNLDTTYVQIASLCRLDSQVIRIGFPTPTIPAGAKVYSVGLRRRILSVVAGADQPVSNHWFRTINGQIIVVGQSVLPKKQFFNSTCPTSPTTATWIEEDLGTYVTGPGGAPWNVVDPTTGLAGNLVGLTYDMGRGDPSTTSVLKVSEVYLDITYQQLSSVTVTAPTGTIPDTRPTVKWTYSSPDSQPQQAYNVAVYTAAQVAAVGFTPFTTVPIQSSGVTLGEDLQWTLNSDLTDGSYSAYVQSTSQWSGPGSFPTAVSSISWVRKAYSTAAAPPSPSASGPPVPAVLSSVVFDATNNRVGITVAPGAQPTVSPTGAGWNSGGTGTTTLAVTPTAVGDCLVLATNLTSGTLTVASVAGGGVTTWLRVANSFVGSGSTIDMWMGIVTTAGSSTITVTGSASLAAVTVRLVAQQFTSTLGASTQWALAISSVGVTNTSSVTVTYPTVIPTGTNQVYVGYAETANTALTSGATAGYTVVLDNGNNPLIYSGNVASVQSPTAQQSSAGVSSAIGVMITAGEPTTALTIQASRDNGNTWLLPDGSPSIPSLTLLPANGMTPLVVYDYVANVNVISQYRAIAYSGSPFVAATSPSNVLSVTPTGDKHWLKYPKNWLLNTEMPVSVETPDTGVEETLRRTMGTFFPLSSVGSEALPFIIQGPTHGKETKFVLFFDGTKLSTLWPIVDELDRSGGTLLLQKPDGTQLWVGLGPGASGTDTTENYNALPGDPTTVQFRRRKLVLTETRSPDYF
jgi:hypothetical protein